jgi:1,4-alpha-glucan branching enzyme
MVMKEKMNEKKRGKVRITFVMPAMDDCDSLYLVGKFDGWNESVYQMHCAEDGRWSLVLELEPGCEYQYRYRTDKGDWIADPSAKGCAPNPDGSVNSVILI